ncbi:hypothetical protein [Arthrobacter sp. ISL-95]|uniref:hypothetical protein n=1 Tax=Arthrobacter sp. ISL-95 TaxID=2819116 RepID=UPI001BE7839A|nr:hypothetical protein [Arthrobacter sp. ISL-95]MBT2586526.1 hypothetical protein [Arthrobacter sp. ISL-95]
MVQKPSEGTEPADHQIAAKRETLTIPRHNPATQQMLVVGKRREAAEAKLQQRLLKPKQAPETTAD